MRILIIAATYPPTRCGVGDYTRRVARELVASGEDVFVLTGTSEDGDHDHGIPERDAVRPRPAARAIDAPPFADDGAGVRVSKSVEEWNWSALDAIDASIRDLRPDVIALQYHGEDYLLHPAVCCVPERAHTEGVAVVTTLHNLQQPMPCAELDDGLDRLLRGSDALICTNTIDETRLREHPSAHETLHVVSTGPSITDATGERNRPRSGPLRVAYFGFLSPFKGVEYLLRAMALVRAQGVDARLEMAAGIHTDAPGRLRDYAASIDAEVEKAALGDALDRRGFVTEEEVTALLHRSHVAVFPFRQGVSGKNTSFFSTMHHGTPTLTTRGPGLPDGLLDGETTMLVDPDDAEALAERLKWADTHRDELEAIGRDGRAYVATAFDWSNLAATMHGIFEAAAARRAVARTSS